MVREPTPKEKAIAALTLSRPFPGKVPTFELEFQLTEELLGKPMHLTGWGKATSSERERMLK